jgi:hypothetical protein
VHRSKNYKDDRKDGIFENQGVMSWMMGGKP